MFTRDRVARFADRLRPALVSGTAVVVPLVITVVVIEFFVSFFMARLDVLSDILLWLGFGRLAADRVVRLATPVLLLLVVIAVGGTVNESEFGERAVDYVDSGIAAIPGVGTIYEGFRQMSDAVIDSEVQNFRDVKVVEFPQADTYTLGFLTARTPDQITDAVTEDEMLTLFLPLAPNPVMGGHLVHVPRDRVYDVDMTVEQGMLTVVTTGVGAGEIEADTDDVDILEQIERADLPDALTRDGDS
ncbi:MAG: DUF502 domain-containing protein [Halobacteriaceae archaeon]